MEEYSLRGHRIIGRVPGLIIGAYVGQWWLLQLPTSPDYQPGGEQYDGGFGDGEWMRGLFGLFFGGLIGYFVGSLLFVWIGKKLWE